MHREDVFSILTQSLDALDASTDNHQDGSQRSNQREIDHVQLQVPGDASEQQQPTNPSAASNNVSDQACTHSPSPPPSLQHQCSNELEEPSSNGSTASVLSATSEATTCIHDAPAPAMLASRVPAIVAEVVMAMMRRDLEIWSSPHFSRVVQVRCMMKWACIKASS